MAATHAGAVLGQRALNRATLARQLLLARGELAVPAAVHHLAGLNAQEPNIPWQRLVLQPLLTRIQRNTFGRRTAGVDLDELVGTARTLLTGRTLTRPELGRLLEDRWPGLDRTALAWSVQYLEPILHPAPVASGTPGAGRRSRSPQTCWGRSTRTRRRCGSCPSSTT